MIAEARRTSLFVMEAMWTRFLPAVAALRDLLPGAIGRCADHRRRRLHPERTAGHYLFDKALGGGALLDAGVYLVSMASMILGTPIQVRATARHGDTGVDEQTRWCSHSRTAPRPCCTCRCVPGERRTWRFWVARADPHRGAHLQTRGTDALGPGRESDDTQYPMAGSGYGYQLREVAAALRAGRLESPIMPLDETLSIMRTMDAMREQIGLRYPDESDQPAWRNSQCQSY